MPDAFLHAAKSQKKYRALIQNAQMTVPSAGWGSVTLPEDLTRFEDVLIEIYPSGDHRGGGAVYLASTNTGADIQIGYAYKYGADTSATAGNVSDFGQKTPTLVFGRCVHWSSAISAATLITREIFSQTSLAGKKFITCQNTSNDGPATWLVTVWVK